MNNTSVQTLNHGPEPLLEVSGVEPDVPPLRPETSVKRSLGGQMDELRLRAVKWSLFHRPLAAARLMAELSALLSSIMFLRNAGL